MKLGSRIFQLKSDKVKFVCAMKEVMEWMPIVKTSQIQRDWLKKLASQKDIIDGNGRARSASRCPGIVKVIQEGWVVKSFCDVKITIENNKDWSWQSTVPLMIDNSAGELVTSHYDENMFSHMENLPKNSFPHVLKFNTPWFVHLPKGYRLLQQPVPYVDENRFTPLPGLYEYDLGLNSINIPFVLHTKRGEVNIEAGTPLVQLIPIKEEKIQMDMISLNDNKKYKDMYNIKMLSEFNTFTKRSYSDIRRFWKSYK